MRISNLLLIASILCLGMTQAAYVMQDDFRGKTFFDKFNFWTGEDPTDGYVNYVDKETAVTKGYISGGGADNEPVIIGTDHVNKATGRGRDSVRIESKTIYNSGLILFDINHMPQGCGTWPAFWTFGPNWPNSGEIDIIEGIHNNINNQATLHTNQGCEMDPKISSEFTGSWAPTGSGSPSTNCWIGTPGQLKNAGCGIVVKNNYGTAINSFGGGVFAVEWTGDFVRNFFFPRGGIPEDIKNQKPDPSTWGKPNAYFPFGAKCPNTHFINQSIVINLTFCGQWADPNFPKFCPNLGNCVDYVRDNPDAFADAYWDINYLSVYEQK